MPRLLLVDGSNYLFRAYHALPPLMTSNGEPTGAIKGFNGMLKNVASLVQPDYKACILTRPGKLPARDFCRLQSQPPADAR